jgi:hypothetical protein
MPTAPGTKGTRSRGGALLASALVVLTVAGVWTFIDYRMQPPPPPALAATH